MSIRLRRLKGDYDKLRNELGGSEHVSVAAASGNPPTSYRVTFRVPGLVWDDSIGSVRRVDEHVVHINLPLGYPKQKPRCTMDTPIWHPNVGDYVCIEDDWSAGVSLVDVIAHIADMIQYKNYNLRSPVNKAAAEWASRNEGMFPVGNVSVIPPTSDQDFQIELKSEPAEDDLGIVLGPARERGV